MRVYFVDILNIYVGTILNDLLYIKDSGVLGPRKGGFQGLKFPPKIREKEKTFIT